MTRIQCGFVGLGDQGAPIAQRMIDAGYPMLLWARRAETLDPFRDGPAEVAADLAALGARAEHVGVCVLGDEAVREVCDALIPVMRPGSRLAIHSTTHPGTSAALADAAAARGILFVDAPVSGGRPGARAGTLTVMIGGTDAAVAAVRPVFESFGRLIVHLGGVGAGQAAKLVNNSLLGANLGVAHAAMAAGDALALDRAALARLIAASSGRSFAQETYARQADLAAFTRRLNLFAQVDQLGAALGAGHPAHAGLRAAAAALFEGLPAGQSAGVAGASS